MNWLSISIDTGSDDGRSWERVVGSIIAEHADGRIISAISSFGIDAVSRRSAMVFSVEPLGNSPGAYVDPATISELSASNYASHMTKGRHEAVKTFISNQPRQVSFTAHLIAHGDLTRSRNESVGLEVVGPALWIDALKYPFVTESGRPHAPPPVIIRLAEVLEMRARVTQASLRWTGGWDDGLPMAADIDLTFTSTPLGFSGAYRGTTRNYSYNRGL